MAYDLEIGKAVREIRSAKAKLVLLQLPDGLKSQAGAIQDEIEKRTSAQVIIWAGSCYGACDTPDVKGVDLAIQWGHSEWL